MSKRLGAQTVVLPSRPGILAWASTAGQKEKEGPYGEKFDSIIPDELNGQQSFEGAERAMLEETIVRCVQKANKAMCDVQMLLCGDLLNQIISAGFAARNLGIPFYGLYGACSTMALSAGLAAVFIDSGAAKKTISVTSSHFCSAERQYRFPLNYGSQRTPTAQWTVTDSGALILGKDGGDIYINSVTFGEIEDLNIKDANNMGAAMAPAAAGTLLNFFKDTETKPDDYDIIFTGDLGYVGTNLLYELLEREGIDIRCRHSDCGTLIFDREKQDVHAGGSGCGCSASVLCSYIMHRLEKGDFGNILFMSTGALMSPTSSFQGESIPGIAHLLNIKKD